jgi:hypothetical protein
VEPISNKAKKISCSNGIEQMESFSSEEKQESNRDKRPSSSIGTEEVKTL